MREIFPIWLHDNFVAWAEGVVDVYIKKHPVEVEKDVIDIDILPKEFSLLARISMHHMMYMSPTQQGEKAQEPEPEETEEQTWATPEEVKQGLDSLASGIEALMRDAAVFAALKQLAMETDRSDILDVLTTIDPQSETDTDWSEVIDDIRKQWGTKGQVSVLQKQRSFTPIPLSLQSIASTFGGITPKEQQTLDRGSHKVRRELFLPTERQQVQLDLPFALDDPLEFVEQRLRSLHDPLVLKVLYVTLQQCQKKNKGYFYYNPNKLADMMGYKRNQLGYHQWNNIARIESKFRILFETTYTWEMPWRDKKLKFKGPLLELSQASVELIKEGRVLAKGVAIYFQPKLFEEITEHKRFAWVDNECFKLNTLKHGKAFLLYSYYSNQLSLGIREHERKIRQSLITILNRSGISIGRNKKRDLEAIKKENDYLVDNGFVTTWEIVKQDEGSQDPLADIWEITMPEDHPAWIYWQKKQKQLAE